MFVIIHFGASLTYSACTYHNLALARNEADHDHEKVSVYSDGEHEDGVMYTLNLTRESR